MPRASKSSPSPRQAPPPAAEVTPPVPAAEDASPHAPPAPAKKRKAPPPKKAKRAKSAYTFFCAEYAVQQADSSVPFGEMSKRCSQAWKALEDKSKYEQMAEQARLEAAAAAPPPEAAAESAPKAKKEKRAPSGYILFCKEKRPLYAGADPNLKFGELSKRCSEAWKALTDEERASYKPVAASADAEAPAAEA